MSGKQDMTMVEHLTELRTRIIWVLVFFVIALIVGLFAAGPIIQFLKASPTANIPSDLRSLSPSDAISVYMRFAFLVGFVLTLPYALFQLWRFVGPGLRPDEKRVSLYFIPASVFLFLVGILFGFYVVFPMVLMFVAGFALDMGISPDYGIEQYFTFLFNMVIPFGFLFEMPILVIFLTRLRILNPVRLGKMRRLAYFGLAVIAITITPPDVLSDVIVIIPLLVLYEISVWLSKMVYRKQLREDEKWEREFGYDDWDQGKLENLR